MTRESARPTPLNLSREMKLLLVLLLMVALIGGWYVWTSGRSESSPVQTPPATPTADPPVSGVDPGTAQGTNVAAAPRTAAGPGVVVQPDAQVDVPTLPAFGAADASAPAAPEAETPPTPGGINPDAALAALPSVNPFRPLVTEADAQGTAPAGGTPPAAPLVKKTPAASLDLPPSVPASPVARVPPGSNGGAPALSPIPGSGGRVKVAAPAVTGGAFPTPTLPGASRSGPEPEIVTLTPPPAPTPDPRPRAQPVTRPSRTASAPASRPPTSHTAASRPTDAPPVTPAPIQPPVAGVSVPQDNIDLNSALGHVPDSGAGTGNPLPGTPASTNGGAASPLTALPTPGTPQPITQLGADSAGASAAPLSALDQLVQGRDLAFNAAVLGPVNTAIFRSRDGFLVVSVGQTLPDSDAVVREVTATSVTLALGNDTKTLELDQR